MNGITLEVDHHNGHLNEEEEGFDDCVPVMVHAESEAEAKEIAKFVSENFDEEETEA